MKKAQRSFVIEYKSGRQKRGLRTDSIWGGIDLKSVARDVEDDTMPFAPEANVVNTPDGGTSLSTASTEPSLTPPIGELSSTEATEGKVSADDNNSITETTAPATKKATTAPKKQRKPRAKKSTSEVVSVGAAAEPLGNSTSAPEKQKRGRTAKSIDGADTSKRASLRRAPKEIKALAAATAGSAMPPATAVASDEMADLLQLEEENKRLRRLLAEKLWNENAELRRRLKLN